MESFVSVIVLSGLLHDWIMKFNLFLRRSWQRLEALNINLRHLNTVRFHMKESFSHRMAKCMLCSLLWEADHFFVAEQPINDSICDILDLNTFIVYEIESFPHASTIKKKLDDFRHPMIEDLVILDLRKMGLEWGPVREVSDRIKKKCAL